MTSRDLLVECNVGREPTDIFSRDLCTHCINPDCTRSLSRKGFAVGDRVKVKEPPFLAGEVVEIRIQANGVCPRFIVDVGGYKVGYAGAELERVPRLPRTMVVGGIGMIIDDGVPSSEGWNCRYHMWTGAGPCPECDPGPATAKEAPCRTCGKPNDLGVKTCWSCGGVP
jgi:hypothetical protein